MQLNSITATRSKNWIRLGFSSGPPLLFPVNGLLDHSLKKGVKIGSKKLIELKKTTLQQKLLDYSYKILAQRSYTTKKLTQKLERKSYEYQKKLGLNIEVDLNRVIKRLKNKSYLNDNRFAKYWIEKETRKGKKSNRAIIQSLFLQGVPSKIIKKHKHFLTSEKEEKLLDRLLEKKLRPFKLSEISKDFSKKNKIMASLVRSGFSYSLVKKTIDQKLKKQ